MSNKKIFIIIAFFIFLVLLILIQEFSIWLKFKWLNIILAIIIALIAGFVIEYLYRKYATKSKVIQTTATPPIETKKYLAKLSLKENHELLIKEFEKIFGREDFLGVALSDDLLFIGKKHFKITKMDNGFYIEDLDTKNGTKLNGEEIRGLGKTKLENGDEILVAKILDIIYHEEKI